MPRVFGMVESEPTQIPVVNAVSEMLGELPEKIAVDLRAGFGCVNRQVDSLCSHSRRGDRHSDQSEADKK